LGLSYTNMAMLTNTLKTFVKEYSKILKKATSSV
jgi:preprotein translocase subunit Sss1